MRPNESILLCLAGFFLAAAFVVAGLVVAW
jgi:hypothetical protein